ncbi:MAG: DNA polymerase ligase N-terminal domain-containing protein [Pseudomonadota bacterium]
MGKLDTYKKKRDFRSTPEPGGRTRKRNGRCFVIQEHDASHLHYDFRLEVNGVLLSWAVPRGLSTDPHEKRLAIRTENHPLAYADFEGVIPENEYGGGTVLIWDRGTYKNLRADKGANEERSSMEESLDSGLIEVWLSGKKLQGGYALKRIRGSKKSQWLIIKMDDKYADARRKPTSTEPESVKTGRTLDDITEQKPPGKHS